MRAYVKETANGPIVAHEMPRPQAGPGEFLLEVHAFGVGVHDGYFLPQQPTYPYTIGIEAAGVVAETGEQVTDLHPGDRVTGVSVMQPKGGTWAQYAAVDASSLIVPVPKGMSLAQAAAVPVAGNTALKALHALPLPEGAAVFIAGGSGAIGTFLIQLAKRRGWRVAASASEANLTYMRELGADLAVDYQDRSWAEQVRGWSQGGVAAAIAIPPGTSAPAMAAVRDGGAVVSISADQFAPERGISGLGLPYQVNVREELAAMLGQIAAGEIVLTLAGVHPFEQALAALEQTQRYRARGKQVVTVAGSPVDTEH